MVAKPVVSNASDHWRATARLPLGSPARKGAMSMTGMLVGMAGTLPGQEDFAAAATQPSNSALWSAIHFSACWRICGSVFSPL